MKSNYPPNKFAIYRDIPMNVSGDYDHHNENGSNDCNDENLIDKYNKVDTASNTPIINDNINNSNCWTNIEAAGIFIFGFGMGFIVAIAAITLFSIFRVPGVSTTPSSSSDSIIPNIPSAPNAPNLPNAPNESTTNLENDTNANPDSHDAKEVAKDGAVSYNFLQTEKGTKTIRILIHDLIHSESTVSSESPTNTNYENNFSSSAYASLSGPRRALTHLSELMAIDPQINSSCHPLAHNLGRAAYQYYGSVDGAYDSMVGTDDANLLRLCNAAYLHGVIEFHLRGVPLPDNAHDDADDSDTTSNTENLVKEAQSLETNICSKLNNVELGPWECRHGIGHGIIQRYRMETERFAIQAGIQTCHSVYKNGGASRDCENGLWMDHFAVEGNIMAMEVRMMGSEIVREEFIAALERIDGTDNNDRVDGVGDVVGAPSSSGTNSIKDIIDRFPKAPLPSTLQQCRQLATTQMDCLIYAATQYLLVNPQDYKGALSYCLDPLAKLSSTELTSCIQGVGAQCAKENMNDFTVVEEACRSLHDSGSQVIGELERICFWQARAYYRTSSGGKSAREDGVCDGLKYYNDLC